MSLTRPQADVIISFLDGGEYSQSGLADAAKKGLFDKPKPKPKAVDDVKLKKEDVDLIVREMEISRMAAERALRENGGDLEATLMKLITPLPLPAP